MKFLSKKGQGNSTGIIVVLVIVALLFNAGALDGILGTLGIGGAVDADGVAIPPKPTAFCQNDDISIVLGSHNKDQRGAEATGADHRLF